MKKKETVRKKNSIIENILGYLLSIALSFVFALYCSWRIGIFLMLTFLLAPVLSLLLTVAFRHMLSAEIQLSKTFVAKKERLRLSVSLGNRLILPSPGILIETFPNPCVNYGNHLYEVNVMPLSTISVDIPVTAGICGESPVGIARIRISDYLGIFTLPVSSRLTRMLSVVPDIAEISGDEDYIRQTYMLSTTTGESDETVETATNVMGGFPGYEHREYVPGDPLKRINWKLSAKRETLYVRLDDEISASSVLLVLDPVAHITEEDITRLPQNLYAHSSPAELPALIMQNAVETSLGVAMTLLTKNLSVTYLYRKDEEWISAQITDMRQITRLQQALASYSFAQDTALRFPFTTIPDNGAAFICTPCRYTEIPFQGVMVYSSLDGKGRQL
ncbi:MAG: DUF58 domain-containing protein [Roseburia sp.]|nr:DUF58 domain-containing protein [Roseburia sp.]